MPDLRKTSVTRYELDLKISDLPDLLSELGHDYTPDDTMRVLVLQPDGPNVMRLELDNQAVIRITWGSNKIPTPLDKNNLKTGHYWLKSAGASNRSIVQYIEKRGWYCINEEGTISLEELQRRGWELDEPVA